MNFLLNFLLPLPFIPIFSFPLGTIKFAFNLSCDDCYRLLLPLCDSQPVIRSVISLWLPCGIYWGLIVFSKWTLDSLMVLFQCWCCPVFSFSFLEICQFRDIGFVQLLDCSIVLHFWSVIPLLCVLFQRWFFMTFYHCHVPQGNH